VKLTHRIDIKQTIEKEEAVITGYILDLSKEELIQLAGVCGMIGGDDSKRDLFTEIYNLTTTDFSLSQEVYEYIKQNIIRSMEIK
jgi:hypothetical protein